MKPTIKIERIAILDKYLNEKVLIEYSLDNNAVEIRTRGGEGAQAISNLNCIPDYIKKLLPDI